MSMKSRMVAAEFANLEHLAHDGGDVYARGIGAAYQEALLTATPVPFPTLATIVTAINSANGGAGIPNVTASTSGGELILTTNSTGTTEAIEVLSTGTANALLGFSTTSNTTGTGTGGPTAGVVTGASITSLLPVALGGLTLNFISTHSSVATPGSITFGGSAGVQKVTGQIADAFGVAITGVQDVVLDTYSTTASNMTAIGTPVGTIKTGSGTTKVWMQTTAAGTFGVLVTDATLGELAMVKVTVNDGLSAFQELQN
jgi:hypothetical protein